MPHSNTFEDDNGIIVYTVRKSSDIGGNMYFFKRGLECPLWVVLGFFSFFRFRGARGSRPLSPTDLLVLPAGGIRPQSEGPYA